MIASKRCWWCGEPAEVDTELPESGGMVKDTDTSWLCADNGPCSRRALAAMHAGEPRNKGKPLGPPHPRHPRLGPATGENP